MQGYTMPGSSHSRCTGSSAEHRQSDGKADAVCSGLEPPPPAVTHSQTVNFTSAFDIRVNESLRVLEQRTKGRCGEAN